MFHNKPLDGVIYTQHSHRQHFFRSQLLSVKRWIGRRFKTINDTLINSRTILHFSHSNVRNKQWSMELGTGQKKVFCSSLYWCLCTTSDSCQFSYVSDIRWKTRSLSYCVYLPSNHREYKVKTMISRRALRRVYVHVRVRVRVSGEERKRELCTHLIHIHIRVYWHAYTNTHRGIGTRQFAHTHKLWHCLFVWPVRIRAYMRVSVCRIEIWVYCMHVDVYRCAWQCSGTHSVLMYSNSHVWVEMYVNRYSSIWHSASIKTFWIAECYCCCCYCCRWCILMCVTLLQRKLAENCASTETDRDRGEASKRDEWRKRKRNTRRETSRATK